jgi:hypothetical protein
MTPMSELQRIEKDHLINMRAHVAYYTGAIVGLIKLTKDLPELREAICDNQFTETELCSLDSSLEKFHRAFYY